MFSKTILISILFVILILFMTGCVDNNGNSNTDSWLDDYTPVHSVGSGNDDFWITFPTGNPSVGQEVQHKTWVIDELKEKPVVFVCHRTGCGPCTPQSDRVKAFREIYGKDVIFYDLDDPFEGYGTSTADILQKYQEGFYYDPNGGTHYIALTGVFTLIKDDEEVKIGWHSWEGDVDDATMENWIKDAIYYNHINSED